MFILNTIQNYDAMRVTLDELIELLALAKVIAAEYTANGVDVPENLYLAQKRLTVDIKQRTRDLLEKRLSEVRSRRAALATPEEKRKALAEEEEKLTAALA